jgi:hypothetical protein
MHIEAEMNENDYLLNFCCKFSLKFLGKLLEKRNLLKHIPIGLIVDSFTEAGAKHAEHFLFNIKFSSALFDMVLNQVLFNFLLSI